MRVRDLIPIKQNLRITARERGKIVARYIGHNIWTDVGRQYVSELLAYASFGPDTPERDDRVRCIGFGIGGTRQLQLAVANAAPIAPPYVGTNLQTDLDPTVTTLERPVRLSGGSSAYPGVITDVWIGSVQAPATHNGAAEVTFKRIFTQGEVSYSPFLSVPLCEVGLFTNAADPHKYDNYVIAYDTFDTISKTFAVELEVDWTLYIG